MKMLFAAAAAVCAAACASAPASAPAPAPMSATMAPAAAPAPAAAVNPVGHYQFATTRAGEALTGNVEITGTPGAYAGSITSASIPEPLQITGVTVNGRDLTVTADTPEGALTFHMNFTDDRSFTGNWTLGSDGAALTGNRVS